MKYTDQQILDAVWRASIKMMRRKVTTNYFGGRTSISDYDDLSNGLSGMRYACYLSTPWMKNWLELELSQGHLKKRINNLVSSGKLRMMDTRSCAGSYNFSLPDEYLTESYSFARQFMRDKGLTSEPQVVPDIERYKNELEVAIFKKFGDVLPEAK